MITQRIKQWLRRMFAWWPWQQPAEASYADAVNASRQRGSQDPPPRTTINGVASQSGFTPRRSTLEEWHGPLVQPSSSPQSAPDQGKESATGSSALASNEEPPPATPEQQLEFLRYLVKRGFVNEGFEQGQTPEQYGKP